MFNSVNLGNFCAPPPPPPPPPPPSRKERAGDFGERAGGASNLYLPSCTYYVPEFSAAVSSFLPQAPSRQLSYPYSAQVPPVREVPYGLEPAGKWHHHPRNGYSSCYAAADELLHRDCLPPAAVTELLLKNDGAYGGPHAAGAPHAAPAAFYAPAAKNSVLPQAFDRFFDSAYGAAADAPAAEPPCAAAKAKGDPDDAPAAAPARPGEAEAEADEEPADPSSSGSVHPAVKEAPAKGAAPSR